MSDPVLPRLRRSLSKASKELAKNRRRFQETPRLLLGHSAWLEPGDWVPVPAKAGVWHHATAALPDAVVDEGGKGANKLWSAADGAPPSLRVKRSIVAGARRIQGLQHRGSTTVPRVEPSRGNATAVVKAAGNRADLVALEPEAGRALRLGQPKSYDHEYVEVRRRFQQYLPAPGFSVGDDGAVLVEEWTDGQVLSGLHSERQVAVAVEVLDRYTDLVENESATDEGTAWEALPRLLEQVRLPDPLGEPLADPRVRRLLTSGLLVPGQGDLGPHNIMVAPDGSSWQVVDFDTASWLPVWVDPVKLCFRTPAAVSTAQSSALDPKHQRVLTAALDRVWVAVGLDEAAGLTRQHLAVLVGLWNAWRHSARTTHPSVGAFFVEPALDDFARQLEKEARVVEEQFARR